MWKYRNSHQRCSMKERILRNFAKFTGKHQCQSLVPWQKGTLAQVFSYEVCKISKNTFFYRTHLGDCFCTCNELTIISYFGKCEYDYCFNMLQEYDNIFKEC